MKKDLHSNMVLFKSLSGQAQGIIEVHLHSNMVLFKCNHIRHVSIEYVIYIPIWFYSNLHV